MGCHPPTMIKFTKRRGKKLGHEERLGKTDPPDKVCQARGTKLKENMGETAKWF